MLAQIFSNVRMRRRVSRGCIAAAPSLLGAAGLLALAGCAPQFQTQLIGQTTTVAGPAAEGPAVVAEIPVPESHSRQVLRYVVSLPRAVHLHYQITCPSAERDGTLGETFESYRKRRLAELERERQAQANLIGSLVGAVAPPVRAGAGAAGPGGSATVSGEVNPGAMAADAAREALPEASLPPGDVGASVVRGSVDLGASAAGRCAMTLATDPAAQDASGAQVFLEMVRLVDVEAEERARQTAIHAEQDKKARELRIWLLGSLQRQGADPLARARARAAAQAKAEEEARRRQAAADAEARRRQAAADAENQRRQAAADVENQRRQAENQRRQAEQAKADQERMRREQQAAAERERREAPERERRAQAERERLAKEEADRQARLAADHVRESREAEARAKAEQAAAERRAREWHARQAAFALRWQLLARLQGAGADPLMRQHLEEARLAARQAEQRRQYEARARRELEISVARRAAVDLRFALVARLQSMGADPEFRRKRDEAMFREMDAEAKRLTAERAQAEERVRYETQAALDLRVLTKVRLHQMGAVDRPTCPPPPAETPPPAPFAGATWIGGRYDWNGIAWIWMSGHYERPPEIGTVWVPPSNIAVSGTLVVRPGRWVRITVGGPPR
jgi:hypothetical protein